MKKYILILFMMFCSVSFCYTQDYNTGIGLRAGFSNGLTVKHFTGLYEVHNRAFQTERLNWYIGFGGHIGFWNGDYANWGETGTSYTVAGIDGILGMDYNFVEAPFNIGIDWKPAFNIIGYTGFWGDGGALSIRYIF
jgi:hypothetical protein